MQHPPQFILQGFQASSHTRTIMITQEPAKPLCLQAMRRDGRAVASARSPVRRPLSSTCARISREACCTAPHTERCVAGPWYIVPTGTSITVFWTRVPDTDLGCLLEVTRAQGVGHASWAGQALQRSARCGVPQAFPEHPSGLGPCGVSIRSRAKRRDTGRAAAR